MTIKYLNNLRKFWEPKNLNDAKFNKIVVGKSLKKMNEKEKEEHWKKETVKAVDKIIKDIDLNENSNIMEIGCGIGRLMKEINDRKKCWIIGIDISKEMIDLSKEYLKNNWECTTIQNSGFDLNMIGDEMYDFVYSYITFQHISSFEIIQSYFKEVNRVLEDNGIFRFQVFKCVGNFKNYKSEQPDNERIGFTGNGYTEDQLMGLMEDNNFKDIKIENDIDFENHLWVTGYKK